MESDRAKLKRIMNKSIPALNQEIADVSKCEFALSLKEYFFIDLIKYKVPNKDKILRKPTEQLYKYLIKGTKRNHLEDVIDVIGIVDNDGDCRYGVKIHWDNNARKYLLTLRKDDIDYKDYMLDVYIKSKLLNKNKTFYKQR